MHFYGPCMVYISPLEEGMISVKRKPIEQSSDLHREQLSFQGPKMILKSVSTAGIS